MHTIVDVATPPYVLRRTDNGDERWTKRKIIIKNPSHERVYKSKWDFCFCFSCLVVPHFFPCISSVSFFFTILRSLAICRRTENIFHFTFYVWNSFCAFCASAARMQHILFHTEVFAEFFLFRFVLCLEFRFFCFLCFTLCFQWAWVSTAHILCISHFRDVILLLYYSPVLLSLFSFVSPPVTPFFSSLSSSLPLSLGSVASPHTQNGEMWLWIKIAVFLVQIINLKVHFVRKSLCRAAVACHTLPSNR